MKWKIVVHSKKVRIEKIINKVSHSMFAQNKQGEISNFKWSLMKPDFAVLQQLKKELFSFYIVGGV